MQSTSKASLPVPTRRAANNSHNTATIQDGDTTVIEIDAVHGRLLGLRDRQRVRVL